jgi:hypothetical protein
LLKTSTARSPIKSVPKIGASETQTDFFEILRIVCSVVEGARQPKENRNITKFRNEKFTNEENLSELDIRVRKTPRNEIPPIMAIFDTNFASRLFISLLFMRRPISTSEPRVRQEAIN